MNYNKLKFGKAYVSQLPLTVFITKGTKSTFRLPIVKYLGIEEGNYKFEVIKGDIEVSLRPQMVNLTKKQILLYLNKF